MQVSSRKEGPVLVISVEGRMDHAGAGTFQTHALENIAAGTRSIVVDFGGTSFLASMGIRALIVPSQELAKKGGRLALAGLNPELETLFQTAGLYQLFKVYPTIPDAIADGEWPQDVSNS
jgi:anti-sigma B factor antagonist